MGFVVHREQWVDGTSGLRGPRHLVQLVEYELHGHRAGAEDGQGIANQSGPLVTALLVAGFVRDFKEMVGKWIAEHIRTRRAVYGRTGAPGSSSGEVAVYVCLCKGLKESDVRRAANAGSTSPETLIAALGLTDPVCCGRCAREIDRLIQVGTAAACPPTSEPGAISLA